MHTCVLWESLCSADYGEWCCLAELLNMRRFLFANCTRVPNTDVAQCLTANLVVQVPYVDLDNVTRQVLPALVTLGSDPNVEVKHASIDAFGAVAQNFKDDGVSRCPRFESSFSKRWQQPAFWGAFWGS